MVIRIKSKDRLQDSVTPSSLNTETDIINLADQDDDYIVEGFIDLGNMQDGDKVVITTYIAVDGTNQRVVDKLEIAESPEIPVVRFPATTLPYNAKLRITINQTAGTLRSFPYAFIVQVMEQI